jgi:hypothetical protein
MSQVVLGVTIFPIGTMGAPAAAFERKSSRSVRCRRSATIAPTTAFSRPMSPLGDTQVCEGNPF